MKGLEALEKLENDECYTDYEYRVAYDVIRKELKDYEEMLKVFGLKELANTIRKLEALEIIKEKLVNLFHLAYTDTKEAYNDLVSEHYRELRQKEYDLLKEVLL